MSGTLCRYVASDGCATITLNRPEAKNALSASLMDALTQAFERAAQDPEIRVVILTGAGDAFCAGLDLREFGGREFGGRESGERESGEREFGGRESGGKSASTSAAGGRDSGEAPGIGGSEPWRRPGYWEAMQAFDGPIIGAVNGPAITAGLELALACDLLIASTSARFADTHVRVGVLPGSGLSQRLPRAIGIYRAKYLSLTGNFLSASQAAEWGLVSHVVAPEELLPTAREIASDMLSAMPHMLAPIKRVIDEGFATTLEAGLELEAQRSARQFARDKPQEDAGRAFEQVRERGREQQVSDEPGGERDVGMSAEGCGKGEHEESR